MSAITHWNEVLDVVVAQSATLSGAFEVSDFASGSVQTPAALTSTALSFLVSNDRTNYFPVRDNSDGVIAAKTITTGTGYQIPSQVFNFISCKLSVGSAEAAARTFKVSLKG